MQYRFVGRWKCQGNTALAPGDQGPVSTCWLGLRNITLTGNATVFLRPFAFPWSHNNAVLEREYLLFDVVCNIASHLQHVWQQCQVREKLQAFWSKNQVLFFVGFVF